VVAGPAGTFPDRAQRGCDAKDAGSRVPEYDHRRPSRLQLEPVAVQEGGRDAADRRALRNRNARKRRVVEAEVPPVSGPDLDFGRWDAPGVVPRSAVSVDERNEVGRVLTPEDGDERQAVDPVAGVVQWERRSPLRR
jgi:hypothetical protein